VYKRQEKEFEAIFKDKGLPDKIELKQLEQSEWGIVNLIHEIGFAQSKSEARRLIEGGGVRIDGEKVQTIEESIKISEETLVQVGKRKFLKVVAK